MEKYLKRRRSPSQCAAAEPPTKRKVTRQNMDLDLIQIYEFEKAWQLYQLLEKEIQYNSTQQSRLKIFGRWHDIPRKQAAYGDEGILHLTD